MSSFIQDVSSNAFSQSQQMAKIDQVRGASSSVSNKDRAKLEKAAQDFEAIFMGIMLKTMRDSVQKGGFMDGGNAEEIYRGMLDQEYAKLMSTTDGMGLAKLIERQLARAAGWENVEKAGEENISHLEKTKGLQTYGVSPLSNVQKTATIK